MWLNHDWKSEVRLESRVSPTGLAIVLLQKDPNSPKSWLPISSWGRRIETAEYGDSKVLLELKILREGMGKLADITAFTSKLTVVVSRELRALLKLVNHANPTLQAWILDVLMYKPTIIVTDISTSPESLHFNSDMPEWD